MPGKKFLLSVLLFFTAHHAFCQKSGDSLSAGEFDDYDMLFSELDSFFDSLLKPRSYRMFSVGFTNTYLNYESPSTYTLETEKKLLIVPSFIYFHKSGLGLSGSASVVNDGSRMNPFLFSATGSYDYVKNTKLITGISFSRFFTKDSLPFYTSPLENELYAYFTWRDFWVKPSIALNYGWGSREEYTEREEYIESFRLRPRGYTSVNIRESIHDFNITASVRKDIYWLDVVSDNDFIRLTPQINFMSGTQKFGFNRSSNTYGKTLVTGSNVLYSSENIYLDDELTFQPLSLSAFIKTEYSKGKFFVQPQVIFDYYFPVGENNFSTVFILNAGVIF